MKSITGLVGIDLGEYSIKMLQLRERRGELEVIGAARQETPRNAEGVTDRTALAECIRAMFSAGGFTGRRCVVSLPRQCVPIHSVRLPRMPGSELRESVRWEACQREEQNRDAIEADYLQTGASLQGQEGRDEVLIVSAAHQVLNTWIEPILDAGLRPDAVDVHFAALARAVSRRYRRESDRGKVRVIVEVGRTGSSVIIVRGDQIAFCKPLDLSGDQFTQAVAEHLQMDEKSARELRDARIAGFADDADDRLTTDSATDRAVFEAVRPLMGGLAQELTLCLRYYGVTFRGHPPDQLMLTGGDGLEPRLDSFLSQSCKMPVVLDDDSATLQRITAGVRAQMNRNPGPYASWGVAAGLSIRPPTRRAKRILETADRPAEHVGGAA